MKKRNCALVLGGYVNGYCIIRELYEKGLRDIILFDSTRSLASHSNKVKKYYLIDKTSESLNAALIKLSQEYDHIILFPTDDSQLESLCQIYNNIEHFCFIPFNPTNLTSCLDKSNQYALCEKIGIPYPKTIKISCIEDIDYINTINYPILIKPSKREDLKANVFRNLRLETYDDFVRKRGEIIAHIRQGISFIASEIIPGDGSNIYAYVGYRDKNGVIQSEWSGKKLSQFPNDFGVFASASNQAPEIVQIQGKKLLNEMDLHGICEPEFKYDYRDGKYKLMEINLRSMMWHRVGNLSGVNVQYCQYLNAIGEAVEVQRQEKERDIHLVYFKHEIYNLLTRKKYLPTFYHNIFKSSKTHATIFTLDDPLPSVIDVINTLKQIARGSQI